MQGVCGRGLSVLGCCLGLSVLELLFWVFLSWPVCLGVAALVFLSWPSASSTGFAGGRGRDAGYPAPPAQIPACGTAAPGSCLGS
jgi:hypothetical protein